MSKSIAKNAVFNMGYNAVSVIFPLVTSAYVARTLGASGVGEVSSAQNLATYFTMIATLGIPSYGVRAIAQARIHKEECNRTFSELFVINLFSTVFSLACYAVLILSLDKTLFSNPLHAIFASLIAMSIFNIEWLYQGFEEYKYITIRSILIKIISFILATVYKGNIIKNLIMDCQSYTKYRPNETTGGIFVSWRRKEELPTGA